MRNKQYSVDLIAQMARCDANYIQLLKLMPGLKSHRDGLAGGQGRHQDSNQDAEGSGVREFSIYPDSRNETGTRICIRVIERFKYTATVEIFQLAPADPLLLAPRLEVRVYHDASTAEVVSCEGQRNFLARYDTPNSRMYHRDEKQQINHFLGEWLSLCLRAGHSLRAPEFLCTA